MSHMHRFPLGANGNVTVAVIVVPKSLEQQHVGSRAVLGQGMRDENGKYVSAPM